MQDDDNAQKPTELGFRGWKEVLFRVKDEVADDNVGLIAAGVAFYGLLALFPAITAIIAISGLIIEPSAIIEQMNALEGLVPDEAMTIIVDQATAVAGSREGGLGLAALLGILIAIYSASKGMSSLMQGMNVAYDESETRGFFSKMATTLGLTVALVLGLILGMALTMALPAVLAFVNLGAGVEALVSIGSLLVVVVLTLLGLAAIYRYGPSRDNAKWIWVSPGALAACLMWVVASAGFAFYVANFASYNESFGTLAGTIILLMWFWISAYVVILGAEINAEVEAQTGADTTVGPREPIGQRGAQKADVDLGTTG